MFIICQRHSFSTVTVLLSDTVSPQIAWGNLICHSPIINAVISFLRCTHRRQFGQSKVWRCDRSCSYRSPILIYKYIMRYQSKTLGMHNKQHYRAAWRLSLTRCCSTSTEDVKSQSHLQTWWRDSAGVGSGQVLGQCAHCSHITHHKESAA